MPRRTTRRKHFKKRYKKNRKSRISLPITMKHHMFAFNTDATTLSSTTAGQGFNLQFALSDIQDVSHITGLFDQYRFRKIVIKFIPMATQLNIVQVTNGSGMTTDIPNIITAIDRDSNANPSTPGEMREYSACKDIVSTRAFKWVFKPSILKEVYRSAISTSYNPAYDVWLDTSAGGGADVPHYGMKGYWESYNGQNAIFKYRVLATYYIEAKCVR